MTQETQARDVFLLEAVGWKWLQHVTDELEYAFIPNAVQGFAWKLSTRPDVIDWAHVVTDAPDLSSEAYNAAFWREQIAACIEETSYQQNRYVTVSVHRICNKVHPAYGWRDGMWCGSVEAESDPPDGDLDEQEFLAETRIEAQLLAYEAAIKIQQKQEQPLQSTPVNT